MKNTAFFITFVFANKIFMKNLVFVSCLLCFLSACTTLQTVSYERLQAGNVNFPEQVRSVGVVNYVPLNVSDKQEVDSLSALWNGDGKTVTEILAQEIAATDYFNQVVICDSALRQMGDIGKEPFPAYRADSLIEALGVDLLFAVEQMQVELKIGSVWFPEIMAKLLVVDGVVTPVVRAYVAGRNTPLFSISKSDTIYWDLSPTLTYGQMVKDASEYAATLPMEHLLPHWTGVDRYYFDGGNVNMRDAGVYLREQDWESAARLWQELYDTGKGKTRMRAAYNLAVYYEMQDDFVRAGEYLDTAASLAEEGSWEAQLIQFYQLQLEESARDNHRLKVQMSRFEP